MTDDPDAIRADIEETRRELSGNVDALADKVTPSKIAHREAEKVKSKFRSLSDRVMGAADSGSSSVGDAASSVGDTVSDSARTVVDKAQGNPLAVGLIAFGVGWLAASLIPASQKEKDMAAGVKEAAQPLLHEAAEAAKQVADDLREPAMDAAQAVKDSATEAVGTVKEEATDAAQGVADDASEAKHAVQQQSGS
jgi:gas vesicle protein